MDVTHFMFTKQQTISYESMLPTFVLKVRASQDVAADRSLRD